MDLNKFTIKSQEALQAAQTKAIRFGHMEVDGEHLLLALLEQADGLFPRLLQSMEVPVDRVHDRLEAGTGEKSPESAVPGVEPGKVYLSQRLNKLLVKAQDEAQRLKDEYVSTEHIFLAFIDEGAGTPAGRISRNSASAAICSSKPSTRCAGTSARDQCFARGDLRSAREVWEGPGQGSTNEQAGPGYREGFGNPPGRSHPEPKNQKQPGPDW